MELLGKMAAAAAVRLAFCKNFFLFMWMSLWIGLTKWLNFLKVQNKKKKERKVVTVKEQLKNTETWILRMGQDFICKKKYWVIKSKFNEAVMNNQKG